MPSARKLALVGLSLALSAPALVSVIPAAASSVTNGNVTFPSNSGSLPPTTSTVGISTTYTVKFNVTMGLTAGVGTITIDGHTDAVGTIFPSTASSYTVTDGSASASPAAVVPTNSNATVQFVVPTGVTIANGDQVTVVISGVTNPTVASTNYDLAVSTSADTTAAKTAAYGMAPGTVDATHSTVTGPATSPTADGSAAAVVATLKDKFDNVVSGRTVSLSQTTAGGHSVIGPPTSGTTNSSGQSSFSVSDVYAEDESYAATDTTDTISVTQQAAVTFVPAGDGTGSATVAPSPVNAGTTTTFTLDYKPAAGMTTGSLQFGTPAGWSAPSTTPTAAGYVTSTVGTVAVSGTTVTVTGISTPKTTDVLVKYGDTSGGGPGTTVPSTPGSGTFTVKEASSSAGALTALPNATVSVTLGPVDSGKSTVTASKSSVPADGSTTSTITVTLKDSAGNAIPSKSVSLTPIPTGNVFVSAPSGPSTSQGIVTFTVQDAHAEGPISFQAKDTTDNVTITQEAQVTFTSDTAGTGTASISPTSATAASTGGTYTVTYSPSLGMSGGSLQLTIPSGWSIPSTTSTDPGYTAASAGTVSVNGQVVTVSGLNLAAGTSMTITYGDASAQVTAGKAAFLLSEASTSAQTPTALPEMDVTVNPAAVSAGSSTVVASPTSVSADGKTASTVTVTLMDQFGNTVSGKRVSLTPGSGISVAKTVTNPTDSNGQAVFTVTDTMVEGPLTYTAMDTDDNIVLTHTVSITFTGAPDGTGSAGITPNPSPVIAGAHGTYTITYTPAAALKNATVTVAVPAGWTAPSTLSSSDGYSTASTGTVAATGQTITVSGLTLASTATLTITYGDTSGTGHGAVAPSASGSYAFDVGEATAPGSPVALSSQPSVTVVPATPDATRSTVTATPQTVVADGTTTSLITVTLLDSFGNPVAGKHVTVTANTTTAKVSSPAVSNSNGVAQFTASDTHPEQVTFTAADTDDTVTLSAMPKVTYTVGTDGGGSAAMNPTSVTAGSTGNTLHVVYTAAAAMTNGAVTVSIPAGWPGPSTTGTAAGYTTAPAGTVTVSGATVTVSGVTLDAGQTLTISYGDTSLTGPGVTAPTAAGTVTFPMQQKATSNGTLGNLSGIGASVTITAAAMSPSNSSIALDFANVVANGTDFADVTVTLKDQYNNPVSGDTVTLTAGSGSSTIAPSGSIHSGSDGVANFRVSDLAIENVTYTARDTTASFTFPTTETVHFVAPPDGSGTETITSAPTPVVAGSSGNVFTITYTPAGTVSSAQLQVVVPNGFTAPSTSSGNRGLVSTSGGGSPVTVVNAQTITVSNIALTDGQSLTITYGNTSGGAQGVAVPALVSACPCTFATSEKSVATQGALTALAAGSPSVSLVPGPVSATTSTIVASPTSVVADGTNTSTVTVTVEDANGNPIPGDTVTLAQGSGHSVISPSSGATSASDGTAAFTVTDTKAEQVTYTGNDGSTAITTGTPAVTFVAGPVSPSVSTAAASGGSPVADGTSSATITVTLLDAHSNPVSGKTVTLSQGSGSSTITPNAGGVSDANGVATFAVTDTKAETVTYTATAADTGGPVVLTQKPSVTFVPGAVSASASSAGASPTTVNADGASASLITVTLRDAHNNVVPGKTVTLAQTGVSTITAAAGGVTNSAGVAQFSVTDRTIQNVTYTATASDTGGPVVLSTKPVVSFVLGAVSNSVSTVTSSPGSVFANGTAASTITVTLLDSGSHPVSGKNVSLSANNGSSSISGGGSSDGNGHVSFTVTDTQIESVVYTARDTTDNLVLSHLAGVNFTAPPQGYWLVASDGGIFPFGDALNHSYGSTGGETLNKPIVGMKRTASGNGYWLVASDGGIFPFGDALQHSYGSTGGETLNKPIVGMARTASGNGYWLVASDGGIFPFGDALQHSYGSTGGETLNQPIVGMAPTASGNGYWLVASDGGIFPFGDALDHSYGSTGGQHLNKPIVGMARTLSGNGYWLVASDGGIFPFGPDAGGWGSTGAMTLNKPIVGMASIG